MNNINLMVYYFNIYYNIFYAATIINKVYCTEIKSVVVYYVIHILRIIYKRAAIVNYKYFS